MLAFTVNPPRFCLQLSSGANYTFSAVNIDIGAVQSLADSAIKAACQA